MQPSPRRPHAVRTFAALGLLLTLAGCQERDEIRHYRESRPEQPAPKPRPQADEQSSDNPLRILGAALPDGDKHWYIKLRGPADKVAKHEAEFDTLLQSVSLKKDADPPLAWITPQGWRESPNKVQFSVATFQVGPAEDGLTCTISQAGGALSENLNRWRGQVGLPAATADELAKAGKDVRGQGVTLRRVDFTGPAAAPVAQERLLGAALQDGDRYWYFKLKGPADKVGKREEEFDKFLRSVTYQKGAEPPVTWTVPEGWREAPNKVQFSAATFQVGPAEDNLVLTVSPAGGSLLSNLNRWRENQLGIRPIEQAEIAKVTKEAQGQNVTLMRVDFSGPGAKGKMPPFARPR